MNNTHEHHIQALEGVLEAGDMTARFFHRKLGD